MGINIIIISTTKKKEEKKENSHEIFISKALLPTYLPF